MNDINIYEIDKDYTIERICDFLRLTNPSLKSSTTKENIKELCVIKLCKVIGLTGNFNYKSDFFNFFSCIVGEAICDKLSIKMHIACDELRLIKYEHINLVQKVKQYLDDKTLEEAFLDAFNLVDKFKYLIPKLKKV